MDRNPAYKKRAKTSLNSELSSLEEQLCQIDDEIAVTSLKTAEFDGLQHRRNVIRAKIEATKDRIFQVESLDRAHRPNQASNRRRPVFDT